MAKNYIVSEFNSCSNTENSLNSIISCHKVKSFFSLKSLQKFNSNDVFQVFNLCFVKHWILNCQSLIENQEERTTWPPPTRQWQQCKFVISFKPSLHPYLKTNIGICLSSKQIYEILGCSLDKSVDYGNFAAVNNLTIIFYTKLTKIWFSIIMIKAIIYMTYWFTVTNTGQRKPFHQICICSKTMQQISLELGHHLVMVFMETRVLDPFIKYSGYCKEHTAQCNQARHLYRVC